MTSDYLEDVGGLDIPGIDLIRIESPSKHNLTCLIQSKTIKLAFCIRSVSPEFSILDRIVSMDRAVKTTREEGCRIGELEICYIGVVFGEGCQR